MKRLILVLLLLTVFLSSYTQKFLRYNMNDGTYNGFYTEQITDITHELKNNIPVSIIQTAMKDYEIPLDNIESISIEGVNPNEDAMGEYRIYEFDNEEGDYKKIYVDNRASLFASKNGDFGANDVILFSSAYNDVACLFLTDEEGRIKKFFDGEHLFFFDYDDIDKFSVLDLSTGQYRNCEPDSGQDIDKRRIISSVPLRSFLGNLNWIFENKYARDFFIGLSVDVGSDLFVNFLTKIECIKKDPELHNQMIIISGISILGDVVGIFASVGAEVSTLGWSTAGLLASISMLGKDLYELLINIFPDSKQMEEYKKFYRDKYSIIVKTLEPDNVKCDKADLKGTFISFNGNQDKIKGNLHFWLSEMSDIYEERYIETTTEPVGSNSCIVRGTALNLNPSTEYYYNLEYECVIDGLTLRFRAEDGVIFTTTTPQATTLGTEYVDDKSAIVKCSYANVPAGSICGVQYAHDGNNQVVTTSSDEGEKSLELSGLEPETTYKYRAFIQYDGHNYYGAVMELTTDPEPLPDLTGTWVCVQRNWNSWNQTYTEKEYTITLHKDGTVTHTSPMSSLEPISSSWSYSEKGVLTISVMDFATTTQNHGLNWKFQTTTPKDPKEFTGYVYNWNFNNVIGYKEGDRVECTLRR